MQVTSQIKKSTVLDKSSDGINAAFLGAFLSKANKCVDGNMFSYCMEDFWFKVIYTVAVGASDWLGQQENVYWDCLFQTLMIL